MCGGWREEGGGGRGVRWGKGNREGGRQWEEAGGYLKISVVRETGEGGGN